jgi:hypothetical protein
MLERVGVFPILDHYYEPAFRREHLPEHGEDRDLPGLDLAPERQLGVLETLAFPQETAALPRDAEPGRRRFHYRNPWFASGDAEVYYGVLRRHRPRRLIEVGAGQSTLLAQEALAANRREDPSYTCDHVCVEPFEASWLEGEPVRVLRTPVEELPLELFEELEADDVLFIDSSHVIRPRGDVLREQLGILPRLRPGVLVHFHDVFTPRDYPAEWGADVKLWNEQYLLEAFLTGSRDFEVFLALNFLYHHHGEALRAVCPVLSEEWGRRTPGSFWIRRIGR